MALIGTLTSGVSALRTFSKGLEVIGNNIANVNTTAFKSSNANFSDSFSNTLRSATTSAGDSAVQIGTGVQLSSISTNFTQGQLSSTGVPTDLGISGAGYFVVQNGTLNYATRSGAFTFDSSGNLINEQGYNVLSSTGVPIAAANYANASSVSIGSDGTVSVFYADGTPTDSSQKVGLLKIPEESKLMKQGNNLYDFASTGAVIGDLTTPGAGGLGTVKSGVLELSNVDLTDQFSNLITTQRSFQAGSRLVTVSDSVLEDVVNLKRN
ncbi:MAG TPA: flagellar hook-basal body complex protein [Opitutus sp.]|nr:flagellar hook-basal body complex protein [Opitutus sp.]